MKISVRRILVPLALVATLAAAVLSTSAADAPARKPNIVFLFADDWGWGDLGCHGHSWLKTPNLDRLASQSIDFLQFNVLNPVCSASRVAVTTGNFPARFSIHRHFSAHILNSFREQPDWLDPKAVTLPHLLQSAGYHTGHFGKWHLTGTAIKDAPLPKEYGFDEAAVYSGPGPQVGYAEVFDRAVDFIKANKDRPFYLNVWMHEVHTPFVPSDAAMKMWEHLDKKKQVYSAAITDGDNGIGRVLAALKDAGLDENTLVIFSSDNGPEWTAGPLLKSPIHGTGYGPYYSIGETGGLRGRKRSLFEGGVRLPFFVRWPGHAPAGTTNAATVVTAVDLLPTLCAAAGVALPATYKPDGENILAAFNGETVRRTKPVFWEWRGNDDEPDWWPRLAVRDGDWKAVMTFDKKRVELYNLINDRAEKNNVAAAYPDLAARLSAMALEWNATLPKKPAPDCITGHKPSLEEKVAEPEPPDSD